MTTNRDPAAGRHLEERVRVAVGGDLPYQAHRWAVLAVERAVRRCAWPLRRADVTLARPPNLAAVCRADINADLGGRLFHVRGESVDPRTALDRAAERLHRQADALHAGEAAGRAARAARTVAARPGPAGRRQAAGTREGEGRSRRSRRT
jgi:hypothetical protein